MRVKYLYRSFDLTPQLGLQWGGRREGRCKTEARWCFLLDWGDRGVMVVSEERVTWELPVHFSGWAEHRRLDRPSPSLRLSVDPEPIAHLYLYGKSKDALNPSPSSSSSSSPTQPLCFSGCKHFGIHNLIWPTRQLFEIGIITQNFQRKNCRFRKETEVVQDCLRYRADTGTEPVLLTLRLVHFSSPSKMVFPWWCQDHELKWQVSELLLAQGLTEPN